jgi:hypothetical protein
MIDDPDEAEQGVLEEIDPDLVSYTYSTRGRDQLIYLNEVYQIKKKISTDASPFRIQWRCKDREESNNYRLNCRITPSIACNLWIFLKSFMKEQISQSRSLYQFQHRGRFVLRRKCCRENEEQIEVLMDERAQVI